MKVNDTVRIKQPGEQQPPNRGIVKYISPCGRFARVKKNLGFFGNKYQYIVNEYLTKDLEVIE
jgi:hypothetical protein